MWRGATVHDMRMSHLMMGHDYKETEGAERELREHLAEMKRFSPFR